MVVDNRMYPFEYPDLFSVIARIKPFVFLDVFLENNKQIENYTPYWEFFNSFDEQDHFFDQIAEDDLISWCEITPETRYPLISSVIKLFSQPTKANELKLKPVIHSIFNKAPDLPVVLQHLSKAISPRSWSGSLSEILLKRADVLKGLFEHDNIEIRTWAKDQHSTLLERIEWERESEERNEHSRNERFE